MKQLLPTLTLLFALIGVAPAAPARPALHQVATPAQTTETVYLCMSKTSYAYHSSDDCQGLNRCSHEVKSMSADDAQKLGKRTCQKCW
jgi:hypothetical protein